MSIEHEWSDYVDATAQALQLFIAPEYRDGVLQNFARIAAYARLVDEAAIEAHDDPAPVFRPGTVG